MKLSKFIDMMSKLKEKNKEHPDCEIILWESEQGAGFSLWDNYKNYKQYYHGLDDYIKQREFVEQHRLEDIEIKQY